MLCHQQSGPLLATGAADCSLRLWDLRCGRVQHIVPVGSFPYTLQVGQGSEGGGRFSATAAVLPAMLHPCCVCPCWDKPAGTNLLHPRLPADGWPAAGSGLLQRQCASGRPAFCRRRRSWQPAASPRCAACAPGAGARRCVRWWEEGLEAASRAGGMPLRGDARGCGLLLVNHLLYALHAPLALVQVWALALSESRLVSASLDATVVVRSFLPGDVAAQEEGSSWLDSTGLDGEEGSESDGSNDELSDDELEDAELEEGSEDSDSEGEMGGAEAVEFILIHY